MIVGDSGALASTTPSPPLPEQQVRDEAHRFALAYHRQLRGKDMFSPGEAVEELEGAGGGGAGDRRRGFEAVAGVLRLGDGASLKSEGWLRKNPS